ncbi:MAG: antibiotic biosynthesis monooxygenase [Pseudomonas sp.]|uniref:antibiotic biosynthesis monooxygenase n=1 Tax=Pseudomonas sp. TaxID=306 RepID=UPI00339A6978
MSTDAEVGVSVIVHELDPQHQAGYERWMEKAIHAHRQFPGYLATDVVKPLGSQLRYVIILRFTSKAHVVAWLESAVRRELLRETLPWLRRDYHRADEDSKFWFEPLQGRAAVARWKQWLLAWLVVLPLSVSMPGLVTTVLEFSDLQLPLWLFNVVVAGLVSFNMAYWLMPITTRLMSRWLVG